MKVALDNTFLTLILRPESDSPVHPDTKLPVNHIRHRIAALIDHWDAQDAQIIIPAPALSEVLTAMSNPQAVVSGLEGKSVFEIASFCERCAVELALINQAHHAAGKKRGPGEGDWQKVKLDKQIVAIAKANGAKIMYTDDSNQTAFAKEAGLQVAHTWELPLPHPYNQGDFLDGT